VKIAGMLVWVLTAGIGVYLLAAGIAAQRRTAELRRPESAEPGSAEPGSDDGAVLPAAGGRADPLAPGPDGATVVGAAALASITTPDSSTAPGGGPGGEGSALLEFVHPLLALTGLTFWIFFVMTDDRLFAWIAFGVVVAAVLVGLSWALLTRRVARRADRETRADREPAPFPAHLVMIHGLAAACTLALVVISAITAART
jgi:hypothetical protein